MTITYKVLTNIDEAKGAWETLSPNVSLNDVWSFRFCQYKFFNYPLHFIAAYDANEIVGVLPLQHNTETNVLEFFGGGFFEDNRIFVKSGYEEVKLLLFKKIDKPAQLLWMSEAIEGSGATLAYYKYELPLSDYATVDDYLEKTWSSKSRKNLRAQMRKLDEQNLHVEFDNFSDLPLMIEFNKERFGSESTFLFPHREEFLTDVIKEFDAHMITIALNGEKEAVGLSVLFNGIMIGINSGRNQTINGLGKYMSLQKIKQALDLKATIYDARTEDLGWKEAFHFNKLPQYELIIQDTV